jgi:hypothetical protein
MQGQPGQAARLLGTAKSLWQVPGNSYLGRDTRGIEIIIQTEYERIVAAVHSALGEEAFAAAHAKGREMTLEQVIEYALAGFQQNSRNKT